MTERYELSIEVLSAIGQRGKPPLRVRELDDQFLEGFTVVQAGAPEVILQHRDGAFLFGALQGDVVTGWTFVEGDEAREAELEWCFRTDDALVARVAAAFTPGRSVEEAALATFGPDDYTAVELARTPLPDGGERRSVRVHPGGAVLRVESDPGGALVGHAWLAGAAAAQELERVDRLAFGFQGARVEGPLVARSVTEALAHARFRGTAVRFARKRRRVLEVFGSRGAERVAHLYAVHPWTGGWSRGSFGQGTSGLFDPAELALWAIELEGCAPSEGPGRGHALATAAECCRQAARFVPAGQELPPLAFPWHTEAARALREEEPHLLSRPTLVARAERLAALCGEVP